jgi:hypothetical protein
MHETGYILTQIFCIVCCFEDWPYHSRLLAPLLNVCMHWRNVIMGFKRFWSDGFSVVIYENEPDVTPTNSWDYDFGIVLDPRNIEIALQGTGRDQYPDVIAPLLFLHSIVQYAASLRLASRTCCVDGAFLRDLQISDQVESLILMNFCSDDRCRQQTPHHFVLPNVEDLICRRINCTVSSTSVTHLSFCEITVVAAITILSDCPNVVNVYFWEVQGSPGIAAHPSAVVLDSVINFGLAAEEGGLDLLKALTMPKLVKFELEVHYQLLEIDDIVRLVGGSSWGGEMSYVGVDSADASKLSETFPNATFT